MGEVALKYRSCFALHVRCENCSRETVKTVEVPDVDDAPIDPEDMIDSAFLQNLPYFCRPCGSVIGRLFKIEAA